MKSKALDAILCTLGSLGQSITDLTTAEGQPLHRDCLADLGRLVVEKANAGLELLGEPGEQRSDSDRE